MAMNPPLKRFLIVLAVVILLPIVAWLLIATTFKEQVGRKIVTEINKQLKSELTVQSFDLSLIRSLPDVSADLQGVILKDSRGGVLLEAENLSFRFGLLSLFGSSLKIKSVALSDGALNIQIDRRGRSNYDIVKSSTEPSQNDSDGTAIDLEQAALKNMEVIYEDQSTGQNVLMTVDDATFAGQFSAKKFSMQSEAAIQSSFVEIDSTRYLVGANLGYNAKVLVDLEQSIYDLQEVNVTLNENRFKADGKIELFKAGPSFDLYLDCTEGNVSSLIALLPERFSKNLGELTSEGNFDFKTYIKGQATKDLNPEIRTEISLQNGRIESPRSQEPLRDVSFTANFTNGKYRNNESTIFEIKNLKGYFNRELFEMRLLVDNFNEPNIDFSMNGSVPMEAVYGLLNNPKITDGSGEVEIKNLTLKGLYEDMINPSRVAQVQASGEVEFDDASLTINEEKMVIDQGRLLLHGDTLSVPAFNLDGAGSDILFQGQAIHIIPVFFADSTNRNKVALEFQANLQSQNLDIDRMLKLTYIAEDQQQADTLTVDSLQTEQIQKRQQFTQFLKGTFDATIQHYNYNLIDGNDFRGTLEFDNNELNIKGDTKAMNGTFNLDGKMYFENAPRLNAKLVCNNLNATEFFRQTENFGQDILTNNNVSGNLDSKIAILAYWDTTGNFQYDKLRVLADMHIRDGALKDFKMLESFSTYVKVQDLRDIRFAELENYLEIANGKIYIPAMFIQSNAMNMTISGEHSFDNNMDYSLKINAGQVLANRLKSFDSNMKPQKAQKNGWFNLYFNIAGTVDEYTVKMAKSEVQQDFLFSNRRKDIVKKALEREFGSVRDIEEPNEVKDEGYLEEIQGNSKR